MEPLPSTPPNRQSMSTARTQAAELIALVRGGDYDRFLAIQLAPKAKRADLYAVTALHVEVARIAESVSEPLIGHIRLAWWREALEEMIAGKPARSHPVLLALGTVHAQYAGALPLLLRMVEARAVDLDDALLAEEAAWLDYCDMTVGMLHAVWAHILDAQAAQAHAQAIRTSARNYAMIGLLRAIPFMAQHGWVRFPQARLGAHQLASLAPSAQLESFVRTQMAQLDTHTEQGFGRTLFPLLGIVELTKLHAKKLKKMGYNPYRLSPYNLESAWKIAKINYL
jgi:phytoene/squalene synthetase